MIGRRHVWLTPLLLRVAVEWIDLVRESEWVDRRYASLAEPSFKAVVEWADVV
jgi:hypothetical protein